MGNSEHEAPDPDAVGGRNPKRVREIKRWRKIASMAVDSLPAPMCNAAREFEVWYFDNRRALDAATFNQDGERAGHLAWKEFKKATARFCCDSMNMPYSDANAAVKALETALKVSIHRHAANPPGNSAGHTPHPHAKKAGGRP
eukprot:CAMPEP_0114108558 /NCGR_PEP_ID=MMETSP0043_2-20121206/293_1 /TAXON_ID=464988 /ORGANISM="Hemiselmis andersenii, Strain CCMP644" /LENGTH=142 /DNA_ID=CAMNT_0001200349 /DNA_START=183 /DNA_END=608 /DNA_ORIENTATION=-